MKPVLTIVLAAIRSSACSVVANLNPPHNSYTARESIENGRRVPGAAVVLTHEVIQDDLALGQQHFPKRATSQ